MIYPPLQPIQKFISIEVDMVPSININTVAKPPTEKASSSSISRAHSFIQTAQPSQLSAPSMARRRSSITMQDMVKFQEPATKPDSILGKFAAPENQDFKSLVYRIFRSSR